MTYALRGTVIYQGEKWLVEVRPDVFQRSDRYSLVQPDQNGVISMHSRRVPDVSGAELQPEVDRWV